MLLDTGRASTKVWQILGVCVSPKSWYTKYLETVSPSARKQSTEIMPNRPVFTHAQAQTPKQVLRLVLPLIRSFVFKPSTNIKEKLKGNN